MKPSNLKEIIKAGLARFQFDGLTKWSRKDVEGAIRPQGFAGNSLEDPEIVLMFRELENEGIIRLLDGEEDFLEVLGSKK